MKFRDWFEKMDENASVDCVTEVTPTGMLSPRSKYFHHCTSFFIKILGIIFIALYLICLRIVYDRRKYCN